MNSLNQLQECGQSIWLDYIRRDLITSGEFQRLVEEDGVHGVTSNPTIFDKAIAAGTTYDDALRLPGGVLAAFAGWTMAASLVLIVQIWLLSATLESFRFCVSLRDEFPDYSAHLWGITSSDSDSGYQGWDGPPRMGRLDGSVVPCAAGGSLPFLQEDCRQVLRTIRERYPKAWGRYGFVDAFNPLTGWYNPDVIGINVGITMLMAENARSGFVWDTFMKIKEAQRAREKAGFKSAG